MLLSAICVPRPLLALQRAKLAFEAALISSGMRYSIVRPTAFFKSLFGEIERVRRGGPFLIFGDGRLTACKPISDADLADYIVGCPADESRWNRILPIGGPGEAITPRQQGEALFALLERTPTFRSVPVVLLGGIIGGLEALGRIALSLAKAELARIGRYYATESMLVLDAAANTMRRDALDRNRDALRLLPRGAGRHRRPGTRRPRCLLSPSPTGLIRPDEGRRCRRSRGGSWRGGSCHRRPSLPTLPAEGLLP